ncbi:Ig-like domain-containing protein [Roseivivax sp. GX 12232]|uniref:Ig-like domain-containing protein n=1 Tax=Roseivivax sp. GX 12232 TaxID=2900547 RepID=UPI001E45AC69|nr:Ig-like domain-containing protein [Roseivivax sp. GX 12232]MCE0507357.1 Ig-like domain-containing protein [Roseivivax sp. GX 12232]
MNLFAGLAAILCLVALPLSAQDTCDPKDAPSVPLCSVGGMLEAVNPPQAFDLLGNLNPSAFAGGANADLMPGQASLSIAGGVSAGGAACARHLSAKRIGGTEGVPGLDQGTIDFVEDMSGETLDVPAASGGTRRAVFEVFSPNLFSFQGGSLGRPLGFKHGGVGGWPINSGAHLVIALTDAEPGDLRAGQSYPARAVGSGGDGDPSTVFSSWTGEIRPRPYLPPKTENQRREQEFAKRMCRAVRQGALKTLELSTIPQDATIGRQVRDLNCDMDGVSQAGIRTRVPTGTLSGTVHIEQITDTKVIGRFELSGTARVERERRTWNPRARNHVLIDSDEGEKPLQVSGRFAAPNMRNMGYAIGPLEVAQALTDGSAPTDELRLIAHQPARDAKNLPWDDPGIRLIFDRPLDPASVTPAAIKVEFGLANGTGGTVMAPIKTRPRLSGRDTVVVTPQEPMRDGVRYRVTVRAGATGIRGAGGEEMAVDQVWGFDTMVDLSDDEFMQAGLAQHLAWREGVESDTIQVVTNAPLVRGKPAAIRVYPKWRADPQIAPGWQVTNFKADIRARPAFDPEAPLLVPEREGVQLRRPDLFTDEERRKGENSVMLFGWTPEFQEIAALRTEIEPVRECQDSTRVFSGVEPLDWDPLERDLEIGYVLARVGPWYDLVPQDVLYEAALTVRRSETYIEQLFPVQSVRFSEAPAPPPDPDLNETLVSAIEKIYQFELLAETFSDDTMDTLRAFNEYLATPPALAEKLSKRANVRSLLLNTVQDHLIANNNYDRFDLVVIFMPYEWIQLLGVTHSPKADQMDNPTKTAVQPFIGMSLTKRLTGVKRIANNGAITHEVGHAFGLNHVPGVPPQISKKTIADRHEDTRFPGIEGIRIAPDGRSGKIKSFEDGNAETEEELLPLMFPRTQPKENQFIARDHYLLLLKNLKKDFVALSP